MTLSSIFMRVAHDLAVLFHMHGPDNRRWKSSYPGELVACDVCGARWESWRDGWRRLRV